jgi:predicted deacylase
LPPDHALPAGAAFASRRASGLAPLDLARFAEGNDGIPYVVRVEAPRPGPHVVLTALVHGNERCGASALMRLIEAGVRPKHGSLSLVFANVAAHDDFDPAAPFASRYLDEDLNRLWSDALLDAPARSREHARAKALRPLIASADALLDLHSSAVPGPPLLLAGVPRKARRLALRLGFPPVVVSDPGHAAGPRLIDYGAFAREEEGPVALLAECGGHFEPDSTEVAVEVALRFLLGLGVIATPPGGLALRQARGAPQVYEVTETVTIRSHGFAFVRPFASLERVPRAGTLLAFDGGRAIITPYDDCVLILPSTSCQPGETAVRLARPALAEAREDR